MPYIGMDIHIKFVYFFLMCQVTPSQPTIGLRQAGPLSECSYAKKKKKKRQTKALQQQMT